MKKQNIILYLIAVIAGLSIFASPVNADMCNTDYGGTTSCKSSDLTINKQVKNPITNIFVENLTTTDPTFAPGSTISYRLFVTNSSGETFQATVKDILPPYITGFVSGSPGNFSFDATNKVLTFKVSNLIAGQSRTFDVTFTIAPASQFPAGKSLFCVTNVAEVTALNRKDSDSAQACFQNGQITGISYLPIAGFDDLVLILPFAGVALGGIMLLTQHNKRISNKK